MQNNTSSAGCHFKYSNRPMPLSFGHNAYLQQSRCLAVISTCCHMFTLSCVFVVVCTCICAMDSCSFCLRHLRTGVGKTRHMSLGVGGSAGICQFINILSCWTHRAQQLATNVAPISMYTLLLQPRLRTPENCGTLSMHVRPGLPLGKAAMINCLGRFGDQAW